MILRYIALAAAALWICVSSSATAQPLTFVVPSMPGGGLDIYARILAQQFSDMGQAAIVENKAGGGTNIGTNYVARSEPNGRTILITVNILAINAALSKSLPFDPIKDLTPVTYLGSQPFVIGVHPSVPATNLTELIDLAKKPGSKLSYSHCGVFGGQHLAGELLKSMTGADILQVPYKGCAPAVADVAAGQLPIAISPITTIVPFVDAGKIRPIALTSAQRSSLLPNVPTVAESGLKGYVADQWWGIFLPGKAPRELVNQLNTDIAKALKNENVIQKLKAQGIDPKVSTPQEFAEILQSDIERWGNLGRSIGLQPY